MIRNLAPLFILSLAFLSACGGGSSSGGGGGTTPQPIMVNFLSLPPAAMTVGGNVGVSATVTNDSANAGVTWSCTPAGACGTFNPTSTLTGNSTTYTAPSAVPTGGKVTLIATSVTDTTKNAQATVTINAPAPPAISVTISTAPPATLSVSGTASVTATVANDSAGAGVNWSCTPAGSCGSFNPSTSPGNTATTMYTAPPAVPSGGKVTLTATSVTDTTKSASSSILITGTASVASLKGQYAFFISAPTGNPVSRGITTWVGSIAFDGQGNVPTVTMIQTSTGLVAAGGVEDIVAPKYDDQGDPILPTGAANSISAYTVDSSGHGTLTISTHNGETLHISFVMTSTGALVATHAVVIELDGEPGSGSMDLQTPATGATGGFSASQVSGAYSFTLLGIENAVNPPFLSFGGVFSAGSSSISSGTIDVNAAGLVHSETVNAGSSVGAPDANGRGILTLVGLAPNPTRTFIYYIVSNRVLRLLENDGLAYMGGSAYSQGSASTTLSGNYVYQHSGWNPALANPPTGRTVAAGQFSVASSSFSGFSDANTGAAPPTTGSPGAAVSGSYTVSATEPDTLNLTLSDAAGVPSAFNAYLVDPMLNILDPNNSTGGGGALLLHTDGNVNGTGILVPQQAATAFLGNYALNLNNSIATTTPNELDLVGVLTANGSQVLGGGATDLADYDEVTTSDSPPAIVGAPLSGAFAIDGTRPGRATGSLTVGVPAGWPTPYPFIPLATIPVTLNVAFYQVSNGEAFIVETDTQGNVSGYLVQQRLP